MSVIELHSLTKTYVMGSIDVPVLKGVTFTIEPGEYVALTGASGSGKSTLMNILGFLDHPTSGSYHFLNQEVANLSADERADLRNQKIGFVFQNFNLLGRTSAIENVVLPLLYAKQHISETEEREWAKHLLTLVGLAERMNHEPSQLSGGQQQRVAIARALINRPQLLLADEPTGNLDSHTAEDIMAFFAELNSKQGLTIVLVTHDAQVAAHAKRIIKLHDGLIV